MTPDQARSAIARLRALNVELGRQAAGSERAFLSAIKKAQESLLRKMTELLASSSDEMLGDAMAWHSENALLLERMAEGTGYYPAARTYLDGYEDLAGITQDIMRAGGFDPAFVAVPDEFVEFIRARDWKHFSFLSDEGNLKLEEILQEQMIAGMNRGAMLGELRGAITGSYPWGEKTGLYEWHAGTYARTAHHRAAQEFILTQADRAGTGYFLYLGPYDQKTREFCAELVGQVFSREQIEEMDNGQTGNVLTDRGGFNCRHQWLPVSDDLASTLLEEQIEVEI